VKQELGRWHGQKRRARGALRRRQFELAQRFPCPAQPGQYSETTTGARSAEPRCGPTRRSRRCARWRPTRRAARPARRASAFGSARDDASSATATCPPAQTRPRPPCRVSTSTTSPAAAVTTTCRCRPRATACPQPASTSASSRHSRSVASRCAVTPGRRSTCHRHRRDPRVRPRGARRQDRGRRRVRQPRTPPAPPRRLHRLPAAQATHPAARPGRVALVCTAARGLRAQDRRAASRVHRQPDPGDGPSCSGKYTHISAGYRAANAGYVSHGVRRLNRMVPMARDSPLHEGLSRLLPHAIDLLERNEGVPLAPRARFGAGPGRRPMAASARNRRGRASPRRSRAPRVRATPVGSTPRAGRRRGVRRASISGSAPTRAAATSKRRRARCAPAELREALRSARLRGWTWPRRRTRLRQQVGHGRRAQLAH
jgi:hypothetical protein